MWRSGALDFNTERIYIIYNIDIPVIQKRDNCYNDQSRHLESWGFPQYPLGSYWVYLAFDRLYDNRRMCMMSKHHLEWDRVTMTMTMTIN